MNITDPDSRNLKCRRGHKQGYNAQAVVTEDQIVIAAELNTDSPDFGHQRSARSRSVHRRRAGSCSGRSSTAMSSGGTRRPPFRARGRPRRWVLARPQLKARCRLGRGGATSRRGPRQLHLPGGAEDRTSPWPSVSFTEVRAVGLPEVAECLQASEFQRGPQALGSSPPARRRRRTHWRSATSPRRCVFLKGIVTSPATARALCHEPSSRGWLLLGQDAVVRDRRSRSWRWRSTSIAGSMDGPPGGRAGWSTSSSPREGAMSSAVQLLDAAGRRRSPATLPDFHAGRAPGNKGQRYAADPPTVDEIIAVMRHAAHARYGNRLNGLIVVLWRAGLRINEALVADRDRSGRTARIDFGQAWEERSPSPGRDGRVGLDGTCIRGWPSARRCRSGRCSA